MALAVLAVFPFVAYFVAQLAGLAVLLQLAVVGLAGAAFLAVVFTRPRWGVYFLVFHVYSGLSFYVPGVVPAAVLCVLLLAAGLDLLRGVPDQMTDGPFWICTALFTLAILMSMLVAFYPMLSFKAMIIFFKMIAMIFLVGHYIRTREQLRQLVVVVFVGTLATIAFGLVNMRLGLQSPENVITTTIQIYRFSGAHANPNVAAAIMCSAIPMGMFVARNSRRTLWRVLAYIGVCALISGMFSTLSRSAIVAFSIVATALIGREVRTRAGYISTAVLLGLALLLTPEYYWSRLRDLREVTETNVGRDFSVLLRYSALMTGWELFKDHSLLGIGLQNFIMRGSIDVVSRIVVHNTYVEVLVGTGLFGFFSYIGMMIAAARHGASGALRVWREENTVMRSLSFYVLLSAVSIAVSALFGSIQFLYNLWIPLAAALVLGRLARDEAAASS